MRLKELLIEIEKQIGECLSESCSRDGCRVFLTDVPSDRVIMDLDCEFERRKINTSHCDYVLFYEDTPRSSLVIVLIELKSGKVDASEAIDELQGGADFVAEMLAGLTKEARGALNTLEITCVPALFHGKGIDRFQLRELERAKVRCFRQNTTIKRGKCGEAQNLALILKG